MLGAIIGDIVGSRFEWENYKGKDFELFTKECMPTDDSIMSLAIGAGLLKSQPDYENLEKNTIDCMQSLGRQYPYCGYGVNFYFWIFGDDPKPYNSYGNGAAMRVSAAGTVASSLEEALALSKRVTAISHNHPEGIKGAQATAAAIYLAKTGSTKEEIKEIMEKTDVEIEAFVHGAMCIAYSGRCTLSNHMTARDSNRGGCCQSCRWEYDLVKQDQDETKALFGEDDIKFAMSPKDLNLLQSVPEMIELGIDSLKVEGRMKSIHYVATVVSTYRKLIDLYCEDPDNFVFNENLLVELSKCANRETAPAFFEGIPSHEEQMFNNRDEHPTQEFIGLVLDYNEDTQEVTLQQRNHFRKGEVVEFFGPKIETQIMTIDELFDERGQELEVARHPKQVLKFKVPFKLYPNDMMRKHVK